MIYYLIVDTIQSVNPLSMASDIIQYFWTAVISFIAGLVLISTFWKKVLKPFLVENRNRRDEIAKAVIEKHIKETEMFNNIINLTKTVEDIKVDVVATRSETQFNGGKIKLRDVVAEMSNNIKLLMGEAEAMAHMSSEAIFKNDDKGHLVMANSALCEIYGVEEERLLSMGWLSYVVEEDKKRLVEARKITAETASEMSGNFTIINQRTGERIPLKYRSVNVKDSSDGKISCTIGKVEKL